MREWTERLNLYIDGELSPEERREVEQKLESCENLRAEFSNLQAVVQTLRELPEQDLPPGLQAKMLRAARTNARKRRLNQFVRPFGAVAAAALLVLVVFAFDGGRRNAYFEFAENMQIAPGITPFAAVADAPAEANIDNAVDEDFDWVWRAPAPIILPEFELEAAEPADMIVAPAGGVARLQQRDLDQVLAELAALSLEVEYISHDPDGIRIIILLEN
ncbi:MAG: zf-HC2 domain-containing protein [Clostridiales bacterium]|jgi:hypothetical protein|nr:zf-HC2 domain-containing protein [Clostridiales bacterium]